MPTTRFIRMLAALLAGGVLVLASTASAGAQEGGGDNYPVATPTSAVLAEVEGDDAVLGAGETRQAEVLGVRTERGAGALPVTGGDLFGLAVLGAGAVAVGALLLGVRRRTT